MAVTQRTGRAKPKTRAGKMNPNRTVKPKNVAAAALADPRYRKRVVKSAKAYSRKAETAVPEDEDA
jgi:stalled ribosome alternative rescue factor ArfA